MSPTREATTVSPATVALERRKCGEGTGWGGKNAEEWEVITTHGRGKNR